MQRSHQVEAGYDNPEKSNLFFKLHQLQTGSWGASSIGRITQVRWLIEPVTMSQRTAVYIRTRVCSDSFDMYLMLALLCFILRAGSVVGRYAPAAQAATPSAR